MAYNLDPDMIIRLIFFRRVMQNFALYYASEIAEINSFLPQDLRMPDLSSGTTPRRDVLSWLANMELKDIGHIVPPLSQDQQDKLGDMMRNYDFLLMQLNPDALPYNWIEPPPASRDLMEPPVIHPDMFDLANPLTCPAVTLSGPETRPGNSPTNPPPTPTPPPYPPPNPPTTN